jgi:MscS family membrane protein
MLETITEFLSTSIFNNSILVWIEAIAIIALVVFYRYKISHIALGLSLKFLSRYFPHLRVKIVKLVNAPLNLFLLVAGIQFVITLLTLPDGVQGSAEQIVRTIFIFILFWLIYRFVDIFNSSIVNFTSTFGPDLSQTLSLLFIRTLKILIIAFGASTIVHDWGYNVAAFVASLGLGGLAFALAAKDTLANFFGSLMIFADRPFEIGDWVESKDVEGTVEHIGLRSTQVRTFAQAVVSVPNAIMANTAVTNWSRMGKRRIKTTVGLTYGTTSEQIEAIRSNILNFLQNSEDIHPQTVFVYFNNFGDSSLELFLYFFTKTTNWEEYLEARQRINIKIMEIVKAHGSDFAFPTQTLHITNSNDNPTP